MKKRKSGIIRLFFSVLSLCFLLSANVFLLGMIKERQENGKEIEENPIWEETIVISPTKTDSVQGKNAYLTFDDGPSDNTDKILDILKEKGVKATFFVVGKEGEKSRERYQRIVREGHTLGMHSYSHDYSYIYKSLENYKKDLMKLRDFLYEVTGEHPWLYRFPGGSSNSVSDIPVEDCIRFLNDENIVYFDWNASSEDAVTVNADCNKLNHNILKDALQYNNTVILMHDLHECSGTVDGLGSLIDKLVEEGYAIQPITKDTKPVQHVTYDGKGEKGGESETEEIVATKENT